MLDLGAQESSRALERRLQYYAKIGLLIIDEVGFLAFDNRNADLLFQVISRRYEKKSLVLTTNLLFSDWHTIFPNATCATALIDRVVHHADVISIKGESYRMREAENDAKKRAAKRPKPKEPSKTNHCTQFHAARGTIVSPRAVQICADLQACQHQSPPRCLSRTWNGVGTLEPTGTTISPRT